MKFCRVIHILKYEINSTELWIKLMVQFQEIEIIKAYGRANIDINQLIFIAV